MYFLLTCTYVQNASISSVFPTHAVHRYYVNISGAVRYIYIFFIKVLNFKF